MLLTILSFIIVLGILVLVHELGHFIAARLAGVQVDEFGFGFPPRVFAHKAGKTLVSINAIPLGGFVRLKGEAGDNAHDPDSYASLSPGKRFTILVAGVVMNFLLAWLLLTVGFMVGTPQEIDSSLPQASVSDSKMLIIEVAPESVADRLGLQPGDTLVSIDGKTFSSPDDVVSYIQAHTENALNLHVARGKTEFEYSAKPEAYKDSPTPILGIATIRAGLVRYGFFTSLWMGARTTVQMSVAVAAALIQLFVLLFTGAGFSDQISGPIGVAILAGQVTRLGIQYVINFTALLSINLGILNALPIPALDGGRMLFIVIEKIKGKAVSAKIESLAHSIGFIVLIALVAFVTYRDILRFGGSLFK